MAAKYSLLSLTAIVFSLSLQVVFGSTHVNESSTTLVCIGRNKEERYNLCKSQGDVNCNISSLADLSHLLQKNTRSHYIQFCTSQIELEYNIPFHQLYDVSFIGDLHKTMINCNGTSNAGMSFAESEGIYLENLIFDQCGALHDSTSVNITSNNSTLLFYLSLIHI